MHVLPHGLEAARRGLLRLLFLCDRTMPTDTGRQVLLRLADVRLIAEIRRFGLFAVIRRELLEGPLRRSTRWRRANIRRVPPSSSLHLPAVVPELSELPYAPQFQLKPEKD